MPTDPLKPCPWCGPGPDHPPELEATGTWTGGTTYNVRCPCCECEGPWAKSEGAATGVWNRRAGADAAAALLGFLLEDDDYFVDRREVRLRGKADEYDRLRSAYLATVDPRGDDADAAH